MVTLASTLGDPVDDDETSTRQLPAGRRSPGGGADSAVGASTGSEETVVGGAPDLSTLLGPAVADDPGDGVVFEDSRPTPAVPSERRATGEDPSGPSSTERVVRVAPVARPAAWSRSRVLWLAGLLGGALAMTAVAVAVALDDADAGPTPVAGPTSPLVGHAERAKDLPEAPPPASTALAGEASAVTDDRAEATAPAAATAPSAASSDEAPGDTEEDAPNADALAEAEDDGTAPAVDPRRGAPPPHRSARRRAHRSATGSTQRNPPPPESQSLPLLVAYLQSQCVHDQPACRGQVLRVAKRVGALSPSEVHTLRARALSCARECSR